MVVRHHGDRAAQADAAPPFLVALGEQGEGIVEQRHRFKFRPAAISLLGRGNEVADARVPTLLPRASGVPSPAAVSPRSAVVSSRKRATAACRSRRFAFGSVA